MESNERNKTDPGEGPSNATNTTPGSQANESQGPTEKSIATQNDKAPEEGGNNIKKSLRNTERPKNYMKIEKHQQPAPPVSKATRNGKMTSHRVSKPASGRKAGRKKQDSSKGKGKATPGQVSKSTPSSSAQIIPAAITASGEAGSVPYMHNTGSRYTIHQHIYKNVSDEFAREIARLRLMAEQGDEDMEDAEDSEGEGSEDGDGDNEADE